MPNTAFNLIVVGGGPVGLKAAIEAASRGQRVAIVDLKPQVTGAPNGAHAKCLREAVTSGMKTVEQARDVMRRASDQLHRNASRELRTYRVQTFGARASFASISSLNLMPTNGAPELQLCFDTVIVATGSRSNRFPPIDFSLPGVFDSDTISELDRHPSTMVVFGAGPAGVEYAQVFSELGAKVILLDAFDKLMPFLDTDLQAAFIKDMKDKGIDLHLNTPIVAVKTAPDHAPRHPRLIVETPTQTIACDCLLAACGRHGCSDGLGLEMFKPDGLRINARKCIEVDQDGWTGVGGIYAVGDVAGDEFATAGQARAVRIARTLYGSGMIAKETMKAFKPLAVWTLPEIAWVGMTEDDARSEGFDVVCGTAVCSKCVRGCIHNDGGFLKLIFERETGRVLGVHIMGQQACELINYGAEVVNSEDTIFDILTFVFPAVTYHVLYHFAACEGKGRLHGEIDFAASALWRRVENSLVKALSGSDLPFDEGAHRFFDEYDLDKSGFLNPGQLHKAMCALGLELSEDELSAMILEASGDPDEMDMDYEGFLRCMLRDVQTGCQIAAP